MKKRSGRNSTHFRETAGNRGFRVSHPRNDRNRNPARRFHFKLNPYVSQTGYYTVEESGAV